MSERDAVYAAPPFRSRDNAAALDFIRERSFATITAAQDGRVLVSHAPVFVINGALMFHLARANPMLEVAGAGGDITLIFTGPDAYVSPDWYTTPEMVPTWNYVRVVAGGRSRLLNDDELRGQVAAVSASHEVRLSPKPVWTMDKLSNARAAALFSAIRGVAVAVDRLDAVHKLSQNRSAEDRDGVIAGLDARGDTDSLAVAALMRDLG